MHDSVRFNMAIEALGDVKIHYPTVDFPVKHLENGWFISANGITFLWTEAGAGYVSERNVKFKYAQFTALVRNEDWLGLEILVNQAIDPIKGAGKGLTFAMVDDRVVGILRHYNMVDHKKLLAVIADCGMSHDVIGWSFDDHCLTVDIATEVGTVSDLGELQVGMRIVNGHSGHHALQYRMLVKARGYEWTAPTYGRSRHMTGVGSLELVLKSTLEQIGTIRFDHELSNMTVATFINTLRTNVPTMTARQEMLMNLIENTELDTAFEAFVLMGQYANTKGYAAAVNGLLNKFVSAVMERSSQS